MEALRRPRVLEWVRRHLHTLRGTWHKTGDCISADCDIRAMHFPPSRYCKTHTG